jgi:hypothetical protein
MVLMSLLSGGCCASGALEAIQGAQALVEIATLPFRTAAFARKLQHCGTAQGRFCTPRPDLSPYLRGTVVFSGALGPSPLPFTEVILLRAGETLATAATDRGGTFFFAPELPAGAYDIVLGSDEYQGQRHLVLDGPARDLLIVARAGAP